MSSQHRPHCAPPSFKPPTTNTTPSTPPTATQSNGEEEEEEEDYMTMCIPTEIPSAPETSLQRTRRLKAAALARGAPPSAAVIAAEQSASRKRALETSLLERPEVKKSRGLAMMVKMGFDGGGSLGKKEGGGIREPIKVEVKKGRSGIGMVDEEKEEKENNKTKKAGQIDEARVEVDPLEYRDRVAKEREVERVERQVVAAQRLARRLDEEKAERSGISLPKKVPVVWRGLAKEEEKVKRHMEMKRALAESLASMHGHYGGLDDDDRMALGKNVTGLLPVAKEEVDGDGDGDGGDAELQEFEGLKAVGRLNRVLVYLRSEYRYCMWCKSLYPDEDMEGCPGISEEEHD